MSSRTSRGRFATRTRIAIVDGHSPHEGVGSLKCVRKCPFGSSIGEDSKMANKSTSSGWGQVPTRIWYKPKMTQSNVLGSRFGHVGQWRQWNGGTVGGRGLSKH